MALQRYGWSIVCAFRLGHSVVHSAGDNFCTEHMHGVLPSGGRRSPCQPCWAWSQPFLTKGQGPTLAFSMTNVFTLSQDGLPSSNKHRFSLMPPLVRLWTRHEKVFRQRRPQQDSSSFSPSSDGVNHCVAPFSFWWWSPPYTECQDSIEVSVI